MSDRPCTCDPSEAPNPCQKRYALSACQAAEIERLRAALRFYADADNYKPRAEAFGDGMYAPRVILDAGYNARAALEDKYV